MFQLLTIGDAIIDTHVQIDHDCAECRVMPHTEAQKLCFDYGSKIPILHGVQLLGGNACNVAAGAVRLGLKSSLLSTVGKDVNGQMALHELAKLGIDTSHVTENSEVVTRYSIVLNYQEERTILSYTNKRVYRWPKNIETKWIYYTALSEGYEALQKDLLAYLKKNPSVRLAYNPGSYQLKYGSNDLATVLKRTDILIINKEEAEQILGTTLKSAKSMTALLRKLLAKGPKEVVITDAERGAWAGTKQELWFHKAFPIHVTSKTGAGDSFAAAYLAARFYKHGIADALAWGTADSASVIQAHGPHHGLLDQTGIKKQLALFPHIKPIAL